jgi:hypothetical protein
MLYATTTSFYIRTWTFRLWYLWQICNQYATDIKEQLYRYVYVYYIHKTAGVSPTLLVITLNINGLSP